MNRKKLRWPWIFFSDSLGMIWQSARWKLWSIAIFVVSLTLTKHRFRLKISERIILKYVIYFCKFPRPKWVLNCPFQLVTSYQSSFENIFSSRVNSDRSQLIDSDRISSLSFDSYKLRYGIHTMMSQPSCYKSIQREDIPKLVILS